MSDFRLNPSDWSEINHLLKHPAFDLTGETLQMNLFIAGRAEGDYEELLESVKGPVFNGIVIPGHDGSYDSARGERMTHGYPGFSAWSTELVQRYGVPLHKIHGCIVQPGHEKTTHTREETDGFILRAQELRWKSLYVLAHPHQMPRLMCCLLKSQEEMDYRLLAVPMFPVTTDWNRHVYGSLGEVMKPRWEHVVEEFTRLEKYIRNGWCAPLRTLRTYLSSPNPLTV